MEFFKDAPWLEIPKDRMGEIIVEPFHPKGLLLGGAPQEGSKVSKLAALAAASKKKARERNPVVSSHSSNASVALLDRLSGKVASIKPNEDATHLNFNLSSSEALPTNQDSRSNRGASIVEKRKRQNSIPRNESELVIKNPDTTYFELSMPLVALKAPPSKFAKVMLGDSGGWQRTYCQPLYNLYYSLPRVLDTDFDAFAGPSPEDIVLNAQNPKSIFPSRQGT